jgi:integrase
MTRRHGLTALAIENAKPSAVRREIPDGKSRGLYLVVQPSGKKSFALRYRRPDDGRPAKLTLGNDGMSLAVARKAAADAMLEVSQGRDPGAQKKVARAKARVAAANTLEAVCEEYLRFNGSFPKSEEPPRAVKKRLRTIDQYRSTLERLVYPKLGSRPIAELKRSEVATLLDAVEVNSGPRMADVTKATLGAVMSWYTPRADDDFKSPIVRAKARRDPQESKRDRVLDDDELRAVWNAAGTLGTYGQYVRFLLLTATRRNEAARMTRGELINGGDWEIPAARYKTKRPHLIPLSPAAQKIVDDMPVVDGSDWVFTLTGRRPVSTRGSHKHALDAASGVTGWRLHDLRRTARSLMSRAGVNADHAERALGHKLGGVRETYDRHEYRAEKKHAFEALAAQIERIVAPQDNVLPYSARSV